MKSYKTLAKAIIIWLIFVVVVFAALYVRYISYPRDKDGMESRYHVYLDEEVFQVERSDYMYQPGDEVPLIFPVRSDDLRCTFSVDGVDQFSADYYPDTGYLIVFVMPANDVTVSYTLQDAADSTSSEAGKYIHIAMEENPTTGFIWEYETAPEGILELTDERYVSDPNDADEPVSGLGGTQFWTFHVVESGTVEIRFCERRGDEQVYPEVVYTYVCDETGASFVEKHEIERESE